MSSIYITFIEREGTFVKIWGQQDKSIPLYIENSLMLMKPQFDNGLGMLDMEVIQPGLLCCSKFKDEAYYRARITDTTAKHQGMIEVLFLDYGNHDLVHISDIRAISHFPTTLISMPAQAKEFILAGIQITGAFNDPTFNIICNELRYMDFGVDYVAQCGHFVLLTLALNGQNVVDSFLARSLAVPITISMQLVLLQSLMKSPTHHHLPPGLAQTRSPPMIAPLMHQQQPSPPAIMHQPPQVHQQQQSFLTFKSLPLKVGSDHTVFVSYVTDGPSFFSIQLKNKEKELQELMIELNNVQLLPMEETILPGCVCLCRSSEDDYICRGVVTNMVDENYKVFFVDFGNTEIRSFEHIFQIPFKYVIPKVMATRFALNGLQGSIVSVDMKIAFKTFVNNKPLRMRVANPSPKTGVPLCDLWNDDNVSALDYVHCASLHGYPDSVAITRGFNQEVKVSYVFSCDKFYIQLRKKEDELNNMMEKLQLAEMQPISEEQLKVNGPCIALYEDDKMYYRAQILNIEEENALVRYVDYGNEESVAIGDLKAPMIDFIVNLRPQAIECCLNGYQNMARDQDRDDSLEEIILEQDFTMKVVDVQEGRVLVDLFDAQANNVALLLLAKLAKSRPPLSPAIVQQETTRNNQNKYSSREPKTDSWRDRNNRQQDPPPQRHNSSNDWRQKSPKETSSFDEENGESPRKFNNRPQRSNNYPGNKRDSWPEGNKREIYADGDKFSAAKESESSWTDPKRSASYGGGDRRDKFDNRNSRENSWNDRSKPNRSEGSWNDGNKPNRSENSWDEGQKAHKRDNSWGNENKSFRRENSNSSFGDGNKPSFRDGNRRSERPDFKRRSPKDSQEKEWDSGFHKRDNRSEDGSEKSFGSGKPGGKFNRNNSFGNSPPKRQEEVVDYAEFTQESLVGTSHNVTISWFYNPHHFFCQLDSASSSFESMMKDIQFAYRKRKFLDSVEVGSSVIALFPEDRALYRAVVEESLALGKFKVLYIDFGNSAVTNRIFPVEKRFMELPAQAVKCSMDSVLPVGDDWPNADVFSKHFNTETLNCQFLNVNESNIYSVELTANEVSIKDELKTAGLIMINNPYEHFDPSYLLSQQIYCRLDAVNTLDDFQLEILPGLNISCAIYQHEKASQPNLELLQSYSNQMIVAFIDDVQESKIYTTLYDLRGQFIPSIELQEEMFDAVNPICSATVIGPEITGYVSHATATSAFIQPSYTANCIEALLEQLFEAFDTTEPVEDLDVKTVVYAVKSEDGNWYRGLVKNISEEDITVQYVDYGNEEVVKKSQLRILTENFFMSYLALEIVMDQAESYIDQEITASINFEEDTWVGILKTKDEVIAKETVEIQPVEVSVTEQTTAPTPVELEVLPEEQIEEPEVLPEEQIEEPISVDVSAQAPIVGFSVVLSHLDNPGQFYLQQSTALETIEELQNNLQPQIPSLSEIENISTGILCTAPYSVDQVWYRAQVLDADSDIITVRFIDYGNTDVLGTDIKIKTLPTELLSLEEHAKRCSLYLSPINNEWTTEACKKFEELTNDAELAAEIVHQDEKTTFVKLYANGVCINDIFIAENYAVELQVETSQSFTGFVSHLNSPSEFWIQFEHACNDLEWIADQLTNAEKFKMLEDQAPGSLCAAIFPDDECWYRARILSNTVAGVEVLFIDYGNSCTCTSLRELPEDLIMVPPLAHKCSLIKPHGVLEWPVGAVKRFRDISADGVTVFEVIKHSQGETNLVQLLFNNQEVSSILMESVELVDASITHCVGLTEFAIRKVETNEKFEAIQGKIQELNDLPEKEEVIVAALYENVWYRAKIFGCIVDKFVVELIDLGLEVDVMEVRQLPEDLKAEDGLATKVKLVPVPGYTWADDADNVFKLFIQDKDVFQVEQINEQVVRLYYNMTDVRENIPSIKCTPVGSIQSTPRKSQDVPVTEDSIKEIEACEDTITVIQEIDEIEDLSSQEEIKPQQTEEKCDTIIDHVQQIITEISNDIVDNATSQDKSSEEFATVASSEETTNASQGQEDTSEETTNGSQEDTSEETTNGSQEDTTINDINKPEEELETPSKEVIDDDDDNKEPEVQDNLKEDLPVVQETDNAAMEKTKEDQDTKIVAETEVETIAVVADQSTKVLNQCTDLVATVADDIKEKEISNVESKTEETF